MFIYDFYQDSFNWMTKITITRALTELKTLDKRIQKAIDSGTFVSYQGQFNAPSTQSKEAVASYQSIMNLLERRKRLKSQIVMSNAATQVIICGKQMTIAEAIETKSSIKHLDTLLARLKYQFADANTTVENLNDRVRRDLENKTKLTSEKDDAKVDIVEFSRKYIDMHGVKLYDPLQIKKKIDELEDYVTKFKGEVDFVLTEKNSTTLIDCD